MAVKSLLVRKERTMQKLHNVLLGVSILPALLVMPAMGDPVQVNDWIGLRNGLMNAETTAMALTGNITAGDFDSDVERMLHGDIQADGFWVLGNKTVDLNGYTYLPIYIIAIYRITV